MKKPLTLFITLAALLLPATVCFAAFNAVVLMYHKFGEDRYPGTSVTLEQFEAQLDYLAAKGFSVLPLEQIVAAYRDKSPLPDKCVAFTVDDAYLSVYEQAFPRMQKRKWPFTVFVASDDVDRGFRSHMTWDQMRTMKTKGVVFANHTATHDYLVRRKEGESEEAHLDRVRADIQRCQRRLYEELGEAPMMFAYPYGEYNTGIARLVVSMGFIAFGQHSGVVGPFCHPATLPRFPVNRHYGNLEELKDKFLALALPVSSIVPFEPVTTERRPKLEIHVAQTEARLDELACYVSGQGRTAPVWLEPGRRFSIQAAKDLDRGRNRYTCTAPNREHTRYFWFSHQFVIQID